MTRVTWAHQARASPGNFANEVLNDLKQNARVETNLVPLQSKLNQTQLQADNKLRVEDGDNIKPHLTASKKLCVEDCVSQSCANDSDYARNKKMGV